jgi:hypothetical protein
MTKPVAREKGTSKAQKYETRRDGSIAYFTDEPDDAEREKAEAEIPAREVGTPDAVEA